MSDQSISIYLDQLHWIHLAQASTNHKNGEPYQEVYRHLLALKGAGKIVCPLSLTHYMELSATGSYRQRTDVATVMAALSGFRTMASASVLRPAEIEQALHKHFGKPETPAQPQPFGFGVSYAASGKTSMVKIRSRTFSMEELAAKPSVINKIKELELQFTAQAEFEILRGPHDSMVQELRDNYGYAPEEAEKIARQRATNEEELAQRLAADPNLNKKFDNIVMARYIIREMGTALQHALTKAGMTVEDLFAQGADNVTKFVHAIPTADVFVAFTKANLKNLHRGWKKNDIHDMDALTIAIPYCDIVVTEKHAHAQMTNAGMGKKYGTKLLRNIEDLLDAI